LYGEDTNAFISFATTSSSPRAPSADLPARYDLGDRREGNLALLADFYLESERLKVSMGCVCKSHASCSTAGMVVNSTHGSLLARDFRIRLRYGTRLLKHVTGMVKIYPCI